jgi:hypothetical protein
MIYLFEGPLPLRTFTAINPRKAIAPNVCLNRHAFMFVKHQNASRIGRIDKSVVLVRHLIGFRDEWHKGFGSINKTFVGDGYYRAAIYETELYIEVMYKVSYAQKYRDKVRSYWWDSASYTWINMNTRRLNPKNIHRHYSQMRRHKRLAGMAMR